MGISAFFSKHSDRRRNENQLRQIVDDIRDLMPRIKRELSEEPLSNVNRILVSSELSITLAKVGLFDEATWAAEDALEAARRARDEATDNFSWEDFSPDIVGRYICVAFARAKEIKEALRIAEEFSDDTWHQTHYMIAELADTNEFQTALRIAKEAYREEPDRSGALKTVCTHLIEAGKVPQSLKIAEEITEVFPLSDVGRALLEAGEADDALRMYERVRTLNDDYPESTSMNIADCLACKGKIDEAKAIFDELLKSADTSNRELKLRRKVRMLALGGEFPAAIEAAEDIKREHNMSDYTTSLEWISEGFARGGMAEEALRYAQGIEDEERRMRTLFQISKILSRAGYIDAASAVALKITDVDMCSEALFHASKALVERGRIDEALRRFLPQASGYYATEIYNLIMKAHAQAGQLDEAIKLADANPQSVLEVISRLADVYAIAVARSEQAPAPAAFCKSCGFKPPADAMYCSHCGEKLH